MKKKNVLPQLLSTTALMAVLCPAVALAQITPSIEPGNITREQQDRPMPAPVPPGVVPAIPRAPVAPPSPEDSRSFVLQEITFEGVTVYTEADLEKLYEDKLGKQITVAEAKNIAAALNEKYRQDDYLLCVAKVASGDIRNGRVVIHVSEGYVANVTISGEHKEMESHKLVESFGAKIAADRPLKAKTLERYLLLIDDLPGVTAKGLMRPSTIPGATDLVLLLNHKKFEGSANINNRGTKFIGREQLTGTLAANSLFGIYDRTLVRAIVAGPLDELQFVDIQHEEQLGSEGTKLVLVAAHTRTEPGSTLKPLDIEGSDTFFRAQVKSPFVRSRKENLNGRVTFDYRDTDNEALGTEISDDKLRVIRAGASYDRADGLNGVNLVDVEVSQGLDMFGATDAGIGRSRIDGEADFTKLNIELARNQEIGHGFSLFTSAAGQYSFDPLLASEEFTLGGVDFGSAYDPAELGGDHGTAIKAELRYGQPSEWRYLNSYQLYTYYDLGAVWQKDPLPGVDERASLASAGIGVRANVTPWIYGALELAQPLTRDVAAEGDKDPRFFFTVTGRF